MHDNKLMPNNLHKQKGFALVGVLIVVVVMAALYYGSSFFWPGNDGNKKNSNSPLNAIKTLEKAKKDIGKIQENLDKQADPSIDSAGKQTAKKIVNEDVVDDVVSKDEFDEYIIKVTNIKAGDNIISPITIEGTGVAFENTLIVELRNQEREIMVKEIVIVKAPDIGKSGPFKITLSFDFSSTKEGYVAVYEESAKDGSEVNLVEIPVTYNKDKK